MNHEDKLVVVLDGGLVQCVVGTGKFVGMEVHVVDYDTDDCVQDDDKLKIIIQEDGSNELAFYRIEQVGQMTITLPEEKPDDRP